jgi:hypothetical protein
VNTSDPLGTHFSEPGEYVAACAYGGAEGLALGLVTGGVTVAGAIAGGRLGGIGGQFAEDLGVPVVGDILGAQDRFESGYKFTDDFVEGWFS